MVVAVVENKTAEMTFPRWEISGQWKFVRASTWFVQLTVCFN